MATFKFSTLSPDQIIPFDPLHDILSFDTSTRPAELLINGTASGVQFSVGGKSIVLSGVALDDLGVSTATGLNNVTFVSPGVLLVGEGTSAHNGDTANILTGGAGDDALLGLGGDDVLNGGLGADLMVGGLGNDTYNVDNAGDVITEEGAGTDTILSSVSYTTTNLVENMTLVGADAINATGNTLANILIGNAAANILDGKLGADTMAGGDGNDTYVVDNTLDKVIETNSGLSQIDTVISGISYRLGANLEDLVLNGSAVAGVGNHRANHITGNALGNTLNGSFGADTMTGGDGNDIYVVDNANDQVVETNNSLTQIDLVASTISYTLDVNLENLRLLGGADINATGNALDNILYANTGNNVLDGLGGNDTASYASVSVFGLAAGNPVNATITSSVTTIGVIVDLGIVGVQDTVGSGWDKLVGIENLTGSNYNDDLTGNAANNILDGGAGADLLTGGKGNDTYVVDGADIVVEAAGEGLDTVMSGVSYRLTANVEYLTLTGMAANGTGNNLDNQLTGNAAANLLDGRAGADKMDGGAGNDVYVIDNLGDEVVDGSGTDLVMTYINHTLETTIENLRLMGTNALNGYGNVLNNIVWVNTGNNVVDGGGGTALVGDTLSYEFGATSGITFDLSITTAQVTGGSGTDTAANFENLIGSNYDDVLSGNQVANVLDGFAGIDTLSYASSLGSVSVNLTAETAISLGVTDVVKNFENILGSTFDDMMIGDLGNNLFTGGGGIDTVSFANVLQDEGGVVVDLTIVGSQNTLGSGIDSFVTIRNLTGSLNDDSLTGDAFSNVFLGGEGNDTLKGGAASDTLTGGNGADSLDGGTGADSLDGGTGADYISGGAGADKLTGGLGVDTFLFDSDPILANIDKITDFSVADDTIYLDHLIFGALATGAQAAAVFASNTTGLAGDNTDRIIYQTTTGNLYYDADANGSGPGLQIATLTAGLALTSADFFVI